MIYPARALAAETTTKKSKSDIAIGVHLNRLSARASLSGRDGKAATIFCDALVDLPRDPPPRRLRN